MELLKSELSYKAIHVTITFMLCLFLEQLAALINDSVGVIATNTAAVQLSVAREKPWQVFFNTK